MSSYLLRRRAGVLSSRPRRADAAGRRRSGGGATVFFGTEVPAWRAALVDRPAGREAVDEAALFLRPGVGVAPAGAAARRTAGALPLLLFLSPYFPRRITAPPVPAGARPAVAPDTVRARGVEATPPVFSRLCWRTAGPLPLRRVLTASPPTGVVWPARPAEVEAGRGRTPLRARVGAEVARRSAVWVAEGRAVLRIRGIREWERSMFVSRRVCAR
mmetsp:Transcript_17115/g.34069  ORF Transcript_17115/g.34069 Transcript_17115/m.34069 type:complete len:216 (+) Transcript_17115:1149-1796(+)